MKISSKCDWVQGTFPYYRDVSFPDWISTEHEEIQPIAGYNTGYKTGEGICVYTHTERRDQGTHFIASGSAISRFQGECRDFVDHVVKEGANIKRIDFCVDVFDGNLDPRVATTELAMGRVRTHAKQSPRWDDPRTGGYTQYVGKKTSDTFMRIYDKGVEQKTELNWIRIECVWKGKRALPAANVWLASGDIQGMIRGFCDFTAWDEWDEVMDSPVVKVSVKQKETDTQKWLIEVAAKTLAREWASGDDDTFYLHFLQATREWYLGYAKGGDKGIDNLLD